MFISYAEGVKAYRILDPVTQCVRTTRDAIFDEGRGWDWSKETNSSAMALSSEFTVDYAGGAGDNPSAFGSPALAPRTPSLAPDSTPPAALTTSPEHGGSRAPVFASPLEGDEDRIDAAHDDTTLCYHTIDDILGDQAVMSESVQRNIDTKLHLTHTGEPCSLAETEGDAAWRAVMQQEMDPIEHNHTWELVDLPAGIVALELQAGQHAQGNGLPAECARGGGVLAGQRTLCPISGRLRRRPRHHWHGRSGGGGL
jgi:hypothetical protein